MNKSKLAKRLKALEAGAAEVRRYSENPKTDEQFFDWFDRLGREGYFDGEPDFPLALECYRQAIEEARRFNPAFEPPKDHQKDLPIDERRANWRRIKSFPRIKECFFWINEMIRRIEASKPPVREAEFHELADWFRENEGRIPINQSIDIGEGRKVDRGNLRASIASGPRTLGVTELVDNLRALRVVLT